MNYIVGNVEVDLTETIAITDLSDVSAVTGSGSVVVMQGSPSITTPTIASFTNATHNHTNAAGGGQVDHGAALTGLTDDDHTQYALLAGRSGGQVMIGGTVSGEDLTLQANSVAAGDGSIFFLTAPATTRMTLFPDGNLTIGNTSSVTRLTVYDTTASNVTAFYNLSTTGTNAVSYFWHGNTGTTSLSVIQLHRDRNNAGTQTLIAFDALNSTPGGATYGYAGVEIVSNNAFALDGKFVVIPAHQNTTGTTTYPTVFTVQGDSLTMSPAAQAGFLSPTGFTYTGAAHTNCQLGQEVKDVYFNFARTVEWATGALATQRAFYIQAPTYAFVGASTLTDAATVCISGAPVAGTNATITKSRALWVAGGLSHFAGEVELDGDLNHDGTNVGFYGVAPVARSTGWTITNDATDRTFDADTATLTDVSDVLATLIRDLAATGIIGAVA